MVGQVGRPASLGAIRLSSSAFCRRKLCPEIIETSLRETSTLDGMNWPGRRSSPHHLLQNLIVFRWSCLTHSQSPQLLSPDPAAFSPLPPPPPNGREANDSLACEQNDGGRSKGDKGGRGRRVDDRGELAAGSEKVGKTANS